MSDILRLPETGRYVVTTRQSSYLVDVDAQTTVRYPGSRAAQIRLDDQINGRPYLTIHCVVGESMHTEHIDGYWRHSTPVESIDPM